MHRNSCIYANDHHACTSQACVPDECMSRRAEFILPCTLVSGLINTAWCLSEHNYPRIASPIYLIAASHYIEWANSKITTCLNIRLPSPSLSLCPFPSLFLLAVRCLSCFDPFHLTREMFARYLFTLLDSVNHQGVVSPEANATLKYPLHILW